MQKIAVFLTVSVLGWACKVRLSENSSVAKVKSEGKFNMPAEKYCLKNGVNDNLGRNSRIVKIDREQGWMEVTTESFEVQLQSYSGFAHREVVGTATLGSIENFVLSYSAVQVELSYPNETLTIREKGKAALEFSKKECNSDS